MKITEDLKSTAGHVLLTQNWNWTIQISKRMITLDWIGDGWMDGCPVEKIWWGTAINAPHVLSVHVCKIAKALCKCVCVGVCGWVSGCVLYSKMLKVLNKNRKALHRSVPSTNNLKNSTRIALCVMTTNMQFLWYRPALLFYENISKCLKLNHVFDNCKLFFSRWFICSSILRAWRRAVFPLTLIFHATSICSTLGILTQMNLKSRAFFPLSLK